MSLIFLDLEPSRSSWNACFILFNFWRIFPSGGNYNNTKPFQKLNKLSDKRSLYHLKSHSARLSLMMIFWSWAPCSWRNGSKIKYMKRSTWSTLFSSKLFWIFSLCWGWVCYCITGEQVFWQIYLGCFS